MSAENRLSADQLAALAPGDTVTIETTYGDRRPRLSPGTVVRVNPAELTVSVTGPRGGRFVERYSRRNGVRTSHGGRAELVSGDEAAATTENRRDVQQINRLYWAWHRRPGDVESLQQLHAAISELLHAAVTG